MTGLAKAANAGIKQIIGRRWHPTEKKWSIPDTDINYETMMRYEKEYGVTDRVDPELFDVEQWKDEVFGKDTGSHVIERIIVDNTPDIGDYL